jgi:hypothetical protein
MPSARHDVDERLQRSTVDRRRPLFLYGPDSLAPEAREWITSRERKADMTD